MDLSGEQNATPTTTASNTTGAGGSTASSNRTTTTTTTTTTTMLGSSNLAATAAPMVGSSSASMNSNRPTMGRTSSASNVKIEPLPLKMSLQNQGQSSNPHIQSNNPNNQSQSQNQNLRPKLGRTTSFNPAHLRRPNNSNANSTASANLTPRQTGHKRTTSHSPGGLNSGGGINSSSSSSPSPSLFRPPPPLSASTVPPQQQQQQPMEGVDRESIGVWVKGVTSQQRLNPHLYTYLASINAFSMPLRPNREALISLYCSSIDPILPLLDREQFIKLHSIGQAPTLLLHAVLLAAARHPQAGQYLGYQSVRQFCATTAAKIRALLYAEVEQDRLTLVRIYGLLSLHSEGPDGLENSCSDIQKAVHYAQSLGLHHERPFVDKQQLCRLWWSIWCMDRISACVNARPLIVNLEDVGINLVEPKDDPKLSEIVQICYKLEQVIYLYRPVPGKYTKIPAEVDELFAGDDTIDPHRAIMALLHHTAIILAHKRVSNPNSEQEETVMSEGGMTAPTTVPGGNRTMGTMYTPLTMVLAEEKNNKNRQPPSANTTDDKLLSAAGSILRILKTASNLPPLPLVPYCASLTLTVFLRTYPGFDTETGFTWRDSCVVLDQMASRWWVAGAMGSMGWNVFRSLEQQQQQQQQNNRYDPSGAAPGNTREPSAAQKHQQQHQQHHPQPASLRNHQASHFNSSQQSFNPGQNNAHSNGNSPFEDMVRGLNQSSPLATSAPSPSAAVSAAAAAAASHPSGYTGAPDAINVSQGNSNNGTTASAGGPSPEEQYLNEQYLSMFSDLPNQTSFLDQAITSAEFQDVEPWLEEKRFM